MSTSTGTNATSSTTTMTEPTASVKLRDYLLQALGSHPGTREFHLHTLISAPRKSNSLYPFATPRPPRAYAQDILVLLSEQPLDETGPITTAAILPDAPASPSNGRSSTTPASAPTAVPTLPTPVATATSPVSSTPSRVLVSAVEATLYVLPSTLCAVLYISKVDSTGQAAAPAPTALLVRSLLRFYVDPRTQPVPRTAVRHLYVHVFARAQAQYLFSASKEWPGKKPLGDTQLCAWWQRCLGRVVADVAADEAKRMTREGEEPDELRMRLYYILPGLSALEAAHALRNAGPAPVALAPHLQWAYGHPYAQADGTPLPCPPAADSAGGNLGCVIPSFDDDPKSRFMDEIAYTTDGEIKSPQRKRPRTGSRAAVRDKDVVRDEDRDVMPSIAGALLAPEVVVTAEEREKEKEKERNTTNSDAPLGELGKVTPDEFWERMSFRQECVAGAVTGFFTLVVSSPASPSSATPPPSTTGAAAPWSPLAPQPGQVSAQINKRVLTTMYTGVEFSTRERAAKATETIEAAIRGLCDAPVGVAPVAVPSSTAPSTITPFGRLPLAPASTPADADADDGRRTPPPRTNTFSAYLDVPRTPPRRRGALPEVSPNPFPEPAASADTYASYIYGRVATRNRVVVQPGKSEGGGGKEVTVLAVRKKVKKRPV